MSKNRFPAARRQSVCSTVWPSAVLLLALLAVRCGGGAPSGAVHVDASPHPDRVVDARPPGAVDGPRVDGPGPDAPAVDGPAVDGHPAHGNVDGGSHDAPDTGQPPAQTECTWSAECASTDWCNPASNRCQPRDQPQTRSFTHDVYSLFGNYCASCHYSPGGTGAIAGQSGVPLVLDGSAEQSWKNVTAGGTTCGRDPHHRVCVDEPRLSLLATKALQLPGSPMPDNTIVIYHSWSDPLLQSVLEWIAQGARYDGPSDPDAGPRDAGSDRPSGGHDAAPSCDGTRDPAVDACVIAEPYAVFVAPTGRDDTGVGTRQAPFATFAKAVPVAVAAHKRVLACGGDFAEALDIGPAEDGVNIVGGFDCATWSYTGTKIVLHPPTSPGVRIHDLLLGFTLRNASVIAPDAVVAGGSSQAAVVVNSRAVSFTAVALKAGVGAPGANGQNGNAGAAQVIQESQAGSGSDFPAVTTCSAPPCNVELGGVGGVRSCIGGVSTQGGRGGGTLNPSGALITRTGGMGLPAPAGSSPGGPGAGGPSSSCVVNSPLRAAPGNDGGSGLTGDIGAGAKGTGSLGLAGWTGIAGGQGVDGKPGQGGGGGGAASYAGCFMSSSDGSCSCTDAEGGGGGGPGGCGGGGGLGGGAGGASIALVSVGSEVTLSACTLTASDGGSGGLGGDGGVGQDGGTFGSGFIYSAPGGRGGPGGPGGLGGSGLGGHSLGIAFLGAEPTLLDTTIALGTPGVGGQGRGAMGAGAGGPGIAKDVWSDWHNDALPPLGAPKNVAVSVTACHQARASWTPPDNAAAGTTYLVCHSPITGQCALGLGVSSAPTSATSADIVGLSVSTTYYVAVRAVANGYLGTWSSEVPLMVPADVTAPLPPSSLALAETSTSLSASWTAGSDDCGTVTYETCISTVANGCAAGSGTWTSATVFTGLTLGTTYFVSVRSVDGSGNRSTVVTGSKTTTYSLQYEVAPAISASCETGCHRITIDTSYMGLTTTDAPKLSPYTGACPWVSAAAPTTDSFIYNVASKVGGACGHGQMDPGPDFRNKIYGWLAAGAPRN